jgi:hypothetical protein
VTRSPAKLLRVEVANIMADKVSVDFMIEFIIEKLVLLFVVVRLLKA